MKKSKGNSPENYLYVLGTELYRIHKIEEGYSEKCPICKGKTTVTFKETDQKYTCPHCYGTGRIHNVKPLAWKLVDSKPEKITSIHIESTEKGTRICYYFGCNGTIDENVFLTKAEAEKAIQKRNKEIGNE